VLDSKSVDKFFENNKVDVVIHCAISGGRRTKPDDYDVVYNNLMMFENLAKHNRDYNSMIVFGSGAETERSLGVDEFSELKFGIHNKHIPQDYYGFSKYLIARRIESFDNIINLRIFNVFGEFEADDRMVKNNINNYLSGNPLEIYQDRVMDFFGANDLYKVVNYIINHDVRNIIYKDLNMCYEKKHTLLDVANIINNLSDKKSEIKLINDEMSPPYCGNSNRLSLLNLEFDGLEKSIREVYNKWKQ
jgi:GDP-L-fucose synthase